MSDKSKATQNAATAGKPQGKCGCGCTPPVKK